MFRAAPLRGSVVAHASRVCSNRLPCLPIETRGGLCYRFRVASLQSAVAGATGGCRESLAAGRGHTRDACVTTDEAVISAIRYLWTNQLPEMKPHRCRTPPTPPCPSSASRSSGGRRTRGSSRRWWRSPPAGSPPARSWTSSTGTASGSAGGSTTATPASRSACSPPTPTRPWTPPSSRGGRPPRWPSAATCSSSTPSPTPTASSIRRPTGSAGWSWTGSGRRSCSSSSRPACTASGRRSMDALQGQFPDAGSTGSPRSTSCKQESFDCRRRSRRRRT